MPCAFFSISASQIAFTVSCAVKFINSFSWRAPRLYPVGEPQIVSAAAVFLSLRITPRDLPCRRLRRRSHRRSRRPNSLPALAAGFTAAGLAARDRAAARRRPNSLAALAAGSHRRRFPAARVISAAVIRLFVAAGFAAGIVSAAVAARIVRIVLIIVAAAGVAPDVFILAGADAAAVTGGRAPAGPVTMSSLVIGSS